MIEFGVFTEFIKEQHERLSAIRDGNVASYIPQLAAVNPDLFSISLCTLDGQEFSVGDSSIPFCIQSCVKPFTYCLAQTQNSQVHDHIGHEPSGQRFNAFVLNENGKPHNPMINSGAMVISSLISPHLEPAMRFQSVFDCLRTCNGDKDGIGFDNSVYLSEYQHANRNYALAYFMKEQGAFSYSTNTLEESVQLYFQSCSIQITTESGARMAATLANHGHQPITQKCIFTPSVTRNALSCMLSSGMYDYSGRFAFEVGIPAKSGVSGCVMLTIPGLGGICIWSPPLDDLGNSVRGVEFCRALVAKFPNVHIFERLLHMPSNSLNPSDKNADVYRFITAANEGDVETVKNMINNNMNVNQKDYDSRSALHLASAGGHIDCVNILLNAGALQFKDRWGSTPCHEGDKMYQETNDIKYKQVAELLRLNSVHTPSIFESDLLDK